MTDIGPQDDLQIDFTDVQAASFEPIPAGWYVAKLADYESRQTKNQGKKMPAGTPGTNWEFHILDGPFANRRVWTNHWHHSSSLGFMKAMFIATERFDEGELEGALPADARDRVVGSELQILVKIRKGTGGYSDSNEINSFKSINEERQGSEEVTDSMLP